MAPKSLLLLLFLSLILGLGLSACLPIPFTGDTLTPEEAQATVQVGIEQTLTAHRRIQAATNAARNAASPVPPVPLVVTETPGMSVAVANTPAAASELVETPDADPTLPPTATPTATLPPTATPTATPVPPSPTPLPTETPLPSPTVFDPNTPTPTPPPTITPQGYQAPPATPVPPTPIPTEIVPTDTPTPEPELAAPDIVLLQIETPAYCRSGPGRSFDLLDVLLPGEWALVTGRWLNPNYYVIETPRGVSDCWLWTRNAQVDGDVETLPLQTAGETPPLPFYTHSEDVICRAGPDEDLPTIAALRANTTVEIIGRTENNTWLLVRIPQRWAACWAPGLDAQLTGNLQAAPVLGEPILTTGEATAVPDPTPAALAEPPAAQPPAAQPVLTPVAGTACRIMSQSPSANTTISPNASFEASWTIRNIGTETWESGMVDIHYLAGSRIHRTPDRFDLPQNIYTGEAVTIKLQMMAPANPGRYNVTWAMSAGDITFCAMPMTLEVR
jgi:hypothetical protein